MVSRSLRRYYILYLKSSRKYYIMCIETLSHTVII
uniref:Uncharacterized protein n=1 Tax=Siphoviridae sp. ctsYA13 TaxID=2825695 RepID=A0A8S5VC51_9CAUD|nr:MAG TPA: hypothetical protein [Siphoviridae sp. ctsYA13]